MQSNKEFMEDVKIAVSLPAQTQRALGPESQEDINMYANDASVSGDEQYG